MDAQGISQFIADWATFLTAIATFLTLLEMNKQRKHSYKPDIVPIEKIITAKMESCFSIFCKEKTLDGLKRIDNTNNEKEVCITLFNLGNGAAKDIKATWIFDFDSFIRKINLLYKEYNISSNASKLKPETIRVDSQSGRKAAYPNLSQSLNVSKDYLLAASIEHQGLKIQLPAAYVGLLFSHIYDMCCAVSGNIDKILFPNINLDIEYSDIANNKYYKSFVFYIDLICLEKDEKMIDFDLFLKYKSRL